MAQLGRAPDGVGRTGSFALARLRGSCARLGSLARKAARKPLRSCSPPAPTAPLRSESCSPCAPPDLLVHFLKEKSFCTYGSNDSTRNRDFHLAEHVSFLKKRQKCLSFCLNPLSSLVFAQRISRRERATLALNSPTMDPGYARSPLAYGRGLRSRNGTPLSSPFNSVYEGMSALSKNPLAAPWDCEA